MKVLPWFALLFAYTAVPADAHLTFAGTPKTDLFSSARLIDTNQSQSLEAVSTADGDFRLTARSFSCKVPLPARIFCLQWWISAKAWSTMSSRRASLEG